MNCPNCLKINLCRKLVLISDLYVCEDLSCVFCETSENLTKNSLPEIKNINNESEHNYNESNLHTVINKENENLEDLYKVDELHIDNNLRSDESKKLSDIFETYIQPQVDFNCNSNAIDLNEVEKQFNFDDVDKPDVNNPIDNFASSNLLKKSNCIFNWLRMPYFFKTHSKIVRILLLHLDIFKFKDSSFINELKRDYSICEAFANQFRMVRVKPICYKFLNNLFNVVGKIPNRNLIDKEIGDRVLCLLNILFDKYDPSAHLKFQYKTQTECSLCHDNRLAETNDYFITIPKNKRHLKITKNELVYEDNCVICKNKSTKSISFINVPEFVILYFPKGLKENVKHYENKIVRNDGTKLSIVGVVESGSKYPFMEYPENPISYELYDLSPVIVDTGIRPSYYVHFRNTNGWYNLNGYRRILCPPSDELSIISLSDVRFIILGTVSDPSLHKKPFSVEDFLENHKKFVKEKFADCFKKSEIVVNEKVKVGQRKRTRNQESTKVKSGPKNKTSKLNDDLDLLNNLENMDSNICIANNIFGNVNSERDQSVSLSSNPITNYFPRFHRLENQDVISHFDVTNTSSGVSSSSSIMDTNVESLVSKKNNDELYSVNSFQQFRPEKSKVVSIDDLIKNQYEKLRKK